MQDPVRLAGGRHPLSLPPQCDHPLPLPPQARRLGQALWGEAGEAAVSLKCAKEARAAALAVRLMAAEWDASETRRGGGGGGGGGRGGGGGGAGWGGGRSGAGDTLVDLEPLVLAADGELCLVTKLRWPSEEVLELPPTLQ
ncbi:MAG: hypothetical protein SGPRY_003307, partial [Prymnesium sp.]